MRAKGTATFRRLASGLGAAALAALLTLTTVTPAAAKGPSSVTIDGPGLDQPLDVAAVTDPELASRFMEQMGIWYGTGDMPIAIDAAPGALGRRHTVTWINSGPPTLSEAERTIIQYIYLEAEDGPLIYTPDQESLEGWPGDVTGWFSAPAGLPGTLFELGVPVPVALLAAAPEAGLMTATKGDRVPTTSDLAPRSQPEPAASPGTAPASPLAPMTLVGIGLAVALAAAAVVRRRRVGLSSNS